jgi:hypothetical protein
MPPQLNVKAKRITKTKLAILIFHLLSEIEVRKFLTGEGHPLLSRFFTV